MGGPRRPVPRRHCPQCDPPVSAGTPPPELTGKSCTATLGKDGPTCSRPAVQLDKHNRPICNAKVWTNVRSHETGAHSQVTSVAALDSEPAAEPVLASVAQDLPDQVDAGDVTHPVFAEELVRTVVRQELTSFATDVLGLPATMAQGDAPVALHPVGLCTDGRCQPCRAQRSGEHNQAKKLLAGDIGKAIEHTGRDAVAEMIRNDGSDALADVLEDWKEAGRPDPAAAPAEQVQVVAS